MRDLYIIISRSAPKINLLFLYLININLLDVVLILFVLVSVLVSESKLYKIRTLIRICLFVN